MLLHWQQVTSVARFSKGASIGVMYGSGPLSSTQPFLKFYIRRGRFLSSTGDKMVSLRQRHATLSFLKFDMRHRTPPPIRVPHVTIAFSCPRLCVFLFCVFLGGGWEGGGC